MNKHPLLKIELKEINDIPDIYYKGNKIENKIQILFDWKTSTHVDKGGINFLVLHASDDIIKDIPYVTSIECYSDYNRLKELKGEDNE